MPKVLMDFMGRPFVAHVDYEVESYGSPPHMGSLSYEGDPGDPPEFAIVSIHLCRASDGEPWFEATGALFDCLANSDLLLEAVANEILEDGPPCFEDEYC